MTNLAVFLPMAASVQKQRHNLLCAETKSDESKADQGDANKWSESLLIAE